MSPYYSLLSPTLTPNTIFHISVPTTYPAASRAHSASASAKGKAREPILREYEFVVPPEGREVGGIKKIRMWKGEDEEEEEKLILADTNHTISITSPPNPHRPSSSSSQNEEDRELQEDNLDPLLIHQQFQIKPLRAIDTWVGLEVFNGGVLSCLSSGLLTWNSSSFLGDSTSGVSAEEQSTSTSTRTRTRILPTNLTVLKTVPSSSSSNTSSSSSQFALAGKDVEISLWDIERSLAGSSSSSSGGTGAGGKKRKNGKSAELEDGEVWRAKNLPNNFLSLQSPIHHTCLTFLPAVATTTTTTATGSSGQTQPQPQIVTGTKSGHVRRYDTRQRKVVADWNVAREGGIGSVEVGSREHELFFSDKSNFLASLDLRTGRILYTYPKQTSTPYTLLPIPSSSTTSASTSSRSLVDQVGLLSISSDATLRLYSTSAPPKDAKHNVKRGEIIDSVGGVGIGEMCWLGVTEEGEELEDVDESKGGRKLRDGEEDGESDEEEAGEDVWEGLGIVDEDEDGEEEEPVKKKVKKVKGSK